MAAKQAFSDPLGESRLRLEAWCRRSSERLSPLAGEEGARKLIDALVAERLGRRIDAVSPEGFRNGLGPTYPQIRAFFSRFAPGVASYLSAHTVSPDSIERLYRIQMAMCRQIAADHPVTLGRSGGTLLSREWRQMEDEQPCLEEALSKLASAPDGPGTQAECRAELDAILGKVLESLDDPKDLLELRRVPHRTTEPAHKGGRRRPRVDH